MIRSFTQAFPDVSFYSLQHQPDNIKTNDMSTHFFDTSSRYIYSYEGPTDTWMCRKEGPYYNSLKDVLFKKY